VVRQKHVKLSPSLLPLALESQLLPGSFARTVFGKVLALLDAEGLIGRKLFALGL
jgi:hypothetical protein